MIWLFYNAYHIICPLLDKKTIHLWHSFGGIFLILLTGCTIYSIIQWLRKKTIHIISSFLILILYTSFSYLLLTNINKMILWNIPGYLIQANELITYYFTCITPCLIYTIFFIVNYFTPQSKKIKIWKNFLITILIPVTAYLYFTLIVPLHKIPSKEWIRHSYCVLSIIGTILFIAFLIRTIFLLFQKRKKTFIKLEIYWVILIGLICPVLGLYFNQNLKNAISFFSSGGIFGDFSHPLFYILAIINGCILLLSFLKNKNYRIILFFAKLIMLPFTAYFFFLFLPFLPLSVFAVIAFGLGFLMLTPLALGIIHFISLKRDYEIVKNFILKIYLWIFISLSILIIPSGVMVDYLTNRFTLHKALNYIYQPNFQKHRTINISAKKLNNILERIKKYKNRGFSKTPYLTLLYKWIVLDNLTLFYNKIDMIQKIFINKHQALHSSTDSTTTPFIDKIKTIDKIKINSNFDHKTQCYKSWIHLTINNNSDSQKEFVSTFKFPEGTFIGDYYLKINEKKMPGQLVEKKAALWIYNKIVSYKRDPSILIYTGKNEVILKVFPVPDKTKRYTGIQLIHPQPVMIKINNKKLKLGDNNYIQDKILSLNKQVVYIPSELKARLSKIKRKPYYHFIMDYSGGNQKFIKQYIKQMRKYWQNNLSLLRSLKSHLLIMQ